jgi:hypothetical protein
VSDFDWLDAVKMQHSPLPGDPPREEVAANEQELAWLLDDPQAPPLPGVLKAARAKDPRFTSLAVLTRALPFRQKMFLKYMLSNAFTPSRAIKKMKAAGISLEHRTATQWMQNPEFKSIIERYGDLALMSSGAASPVSILNRIDHVVEDAMTPVPRFHDGRVLRDDAGQVVHEVDRNAALKGLKTMAEVAGMLKKDEENRQRVTVVLDFSGDTLQGEQAEKSDDVLDGEFDEVKS